MAPRASFMSPETGSDVEPSTTCTVTGIDRIAPILEGPPRGCGVGGSMAVGGSGVMAAASMKILLNDVGVVGGRSSRPSLRLCGFVSLCDRVLDFETVAAVRLAELA